MSLRDTIASLLREGEEIRLRIYRLCDPTDRRGLYKGPHVEVVRWRKDVADLLADRLPGSDANDRFQRMNLPYDHRPCGQVEWGQRWLSDLMANLTAVSNALPQLRARLRSGDWARGDWQALMVATPGKRPHHLGST